uniref:Uncharacterized protein n=1 Tax=Sus scrofa TaxID=9823 RepID=A0A480I5J1_PIG
MRDPSRICGLCHSSRQRRVERTEPTSSWILVGFVSAAPQGELPVYLNLNTSQHKYHMTKPGNVEKLSLYHLKYPCKPCLGLMFPFLAVLMLDSFIRIDVLSTPAKYTPPRKMNDYKHHPLHEMCSVKVEGFTWKSVF